VTDSEEKGSDVSQYEFSGIEERHGHIPGWLMLVYISMAIFMVWYLVGNWTE
jgi:hypothetical protein